MNPSRRSLVRASGAALAALGVPAVRAQQDAWPSRPVKIVSPYPPGGIVDILSRVVGDRLQKSLGQPVIVEARPGAGGNVGTAFVARTGRGDPYTLLMGASGPLAANVTLYKSLGYDPLKDFSPITLVAAGPLVLILSTSARARDYPELIAQLKADRDKATFASAGSGTPQHLTAELFKQRVGASSTHVPYKGGAPAVNAMLTGEVTFSFETLVTALPHIRSGKLRALAITSAKRSAELPDLPTMQELGLAGFEARGWYGLLAPADVPAAIVRRLNTETVTILREPEVVARLAALGCESVPGTPEQFRTFMAAEIDKWRDVIQKAGITAE